MQLKTKKYKINWSQLKKKRVGGEEVSNIANKNLFGISANLQAGKSQERNVSNQDFFFCEVLIKTLIQD